MAEIVIVGKSKGIKELMSFISKSAKSNANVLFTGETGVGKELAAKMIHAISQRKAKPFIKLNSANLNENLFESQLFGHKKGAYTGAYFEKQGLIEEAHEGVFFFDEIADTSPYIQAKMLEVIEQKKMRRLGENIYRDLDIRYIFATNKDLRALIEKDKFREDLYFRINILTFRIPPLREREEDIPLLVAAYIKKLEMKYSEKKCISTFALDKIREYDFPGNVRELENMLERAYVCSETDAIQPEDIIPEGYTRNHGPRSKITPAIIQKQLLSNGGNRARTAKCLGISRQWLHKLIKMNSV